MRSGGNRRFYSASPHSHTIIAGWCWKHDQSSWCPRLATPTRCPGGMTPGARPGCYPSQPFPKLSEKNELPHPFAVVPGRALSLWDSWKSHRDTGQRKKDGEGRGEEQQRNKNAGQQTKMGPDQAAAGSRVDTLLCQIQAFSFRFHPLLSFTSNPHKFPEFNQKLPFISHVGVLEIFCCASWLWPCDRQVGIACFLICSNLKMRQG